LHASEKDQPQMNADQRRFDHAHLTRTIIGVFFEVYNELGFGFLESVYKEAMTIALEVTGLKVEKEFGLEACFRGHVVGSFKVDLLVNQCVIVELKAVRALGPAHEAQTLNYLRAGVLEVGLLLNFGPEPQIRRLAYSNERKVCQAPARPEALESGGRPETPSICVHLRRTSVLLLDHTESHSLS
jgi:GxxExxY protein